MIRIRVERVIELEKRTKRVSMRAQYQVAISKSTTIVYKGADLDINYAGTKKSALRDSNLVLNK